MMTRPEPPGPDSREETAGALDRWPAINGVARFIFRPGSAPVVRADAAGAEGWRGLQSRRGRSRPAADGDHRQRVGMDQGVTRPLLPRVRPLAAGP